MSELKVNELGVRARGQRLRCQTTPVGKSMTKQADLKQANIHNILSKFQKTGHLPQRTVDPIPGRS